MIVSLQHGIKTASLGTTDCQMKIMSGIFFYFLFIIPSQEAQVSNLIPALVLSVLLKESLLLFRKSKLSSCNQNVGAQPTLRFNSNVFSHPLSG